MPRCNLTIKQKIQIIQLHGTLSTDLIARKFRVHQTTVTRIIAKKEKVLKQASRVNTSFKTVQTIGRSEEHDTLVLNYIKQKQQIGEPISIKDICDKAFEFAKSLDRPIKSKRSWWRRFKSRCQIVKHRLQHKTSDLSENDQIDAITTPAPNEPFPNKRIKVYTFKVKEPLSRHVNGNHSSNCDNNTT